MFGMCTSTVYSVHYTYSIYVIMGLVFKIYNMSSIYIGSYILTLNNQYTV